MKKSQIYRRNQRVPETSGVIWEYMQSLIEKHVKLGHIIDDMSE